MFSPDLLAKGAEVTTINAIPMFAALNESSGPSRAKHINMLRFEPCVLGVCGKLNCVASFKVVLYPGNLDACFVPAEEAAFDHLGVGEHCCLRAAVCFPDACCIFNLKSRQARKCIPARKDWAR
jgi:hypothetical protein